MKESRLFGTLVSPSILSFIISCLFAGLILLGASWSDLRTQPFFATYLSGDYGFNSLLHEMNIALGTAFNSNLSYNIAVICFAVLFGLGVYAVIESLRHMIAEAHNTLDELERVDPHSKQVIEKSVGIRVGLRGLSGLVWLGYAIFFFNAILPFAASLIAKGTENTALQASLWNLLAFGLLLLATHLHVVFIRLILLRPRLFGTQNVIVGRGGH